MIATKVIHCSNDEEFFLVGATVGSVQASLADSFNIPAAAIAFLDGMRVDLGHRLRGGETLEFCLGWGRKGAGEDRDEYFLRSPDPQLKLNEILVRLRRVEEQLIQSNKLQAPSKEFYSVEDFAELVDLAPYTVREHCRLGRLNAEKAAFGRGGIREWRISHTELVRYRNFGLLPLRKN
jgi:hypothetical protein